MDKETVLTRIQEAGIVAVVRAETSEQAVRIADACMEGGVAAIELTFTVPQADKVIADLAKRYADGGIILGAGSSLTAGAKTGDYQRITETGRRFVENIRQARAQLR